MDLFQIGIGYTNLYLFTIRLHNGSLYMWRKLGPGRYSLDIGYVSFVFEKYRSL